METSGRSSLLPNFLKVFSSFPLLQTHLAAEFRILSFLDIINLVPSSFIFIYLFSQNIFSQGFSSLSGYSNSVLFNAFSSNKSSGHPVVIWAVTSLFLQTYELLREKYFNLLLLLFKDILTSWFKKKKKNCGVSKPDSFPPASGLGCPYLEYLSRHFLSPIKSSCLSYSSLRSGAIPAGLGQCHQWFINRFSHWEETFGQS